MKINANNLRIGNVLEFNKELWTVIKLSHVKPGKGGAFIQTELKNIKDNRKLNERFRTSENLEKVILIEKIGSFLYKNGPTIVIMDSETFDQYEIDESVIGEQSIFLIEGMNIIINFYENEILSITLPETCEVEVLEADAVIKGQTVSSSFKPAIVTNNIRVMVPGHIEIGSKIIIKPIDGSYVEKSKN